MSWAPGDHPRDDLAVYALDALEGAERAALEAHLATCPECQEDLMVYRETLAFTVEDEEPPPDLWDRIVDVIDAHLDAEIGARQSEVDAGLDDAWLDDAGLDDAPVGDETLPPAEPLTPVPPVPPLSPVPPLPPDRRPVEDLPGADVEPPRHLRPRNPRRRLVALVAAAAAIIAVVAVGPAVVDRISGDDDTEVVSPDLPRGTIAAEDGTPVARVEADEQGSFVDLSDATPLGADRTYQLWSLDGPQPESLGLLGLGGDDDVRVTLPAGTTQVAISDEPASGSPQPTGPIVGTGSLALPS